MTRHDRSGFTLLEITVTLAILGVVMAIVFGVFAQTMSGKEHAESRAEELASARAALARMTSDLTSVRIKRKTAPSAANAAPPTPTPTPSNRSMGAAQTIRPEDGLFLGRVHSDRGLAADDIAFSTFVRRPTAITYASSDLAIVHYFIDTTADDPQRRGLYREALFSLAGQAFDPDKPDVAASVLLLPGVSELDLRYFDGKDWVDGWDSSDNRNFAPAPYAVQIRMAVTNERGESETFETAVDLPTMRNLKNPQVAATPRS